MGTELDRVAPEVRMAELTGVLLEGGGSLVVEAGVAGEGAVTVTLYWRQDAPAKG